MRSSSQQIKQQGHPAHYEQDEADPYENVERFLLRRGRMDPNRHVKTTNQTSQESHRCPHLRTNGSEYLL